MAFANVGRASGRWAKNDNRHALVQSEGKYEVMINALPCTRALIALLLSVPTLLITACTPSPVSHLDRVKAAGELVVLTRNSPTTYYEGPTGLAGIEYDLAKAFADSLGVKLRMEVLGNTTEIFQALRGGGGDLAAAGLVVTEERTKSVRFATPYQEIRPLVVHRLGTKKPKSVLELAGRHLEVPAGSAYAELLRVQAQANPAITWTEVQGAEVEELLLHVWEGLLDLAIADSNLLALNRQYYPELQPAFEIGPPQKLAWAFSYSGDNTLFNEAEQFLSAFRSRDLKRLIERYYGPARRFNYFNTTYFHARIHDTLPRYRHLFEKAAATYSLDWRLLAAAAYQESYWDPSAVSPTGVAGIMMLTIDTSTYVGITDRRDPEQSIEGGARYLRSMIDRMPPRVLQPDRTWMALAAYNVGIRHLEDARIITQQQGGDPNAWHDVALRLPLLAKEEWYSKTKYGYARGHEPVHYVQRIRNYYDILVRVDEQEKAKNTNSVILQLKAPAI